MTLEGCSGSRCFPRTSPTAAAHVHYVIPVALGDSYHALGEFEKAERYHLQAAGYALINLDIEAAALWRKLAENVLSWGNFFTRTRSPGCTEGLTAKMELVGTTSVVDAAAQLYSDAALARLAPRSSTCSRPTRRKA